LALKSSDLEYTIKQYSAGPSGGTAITQNQNAFFQEDDLSKPNRKYSIATTVVAAPNTAPRKITFRNAKAVSGMSGKNGSRKKKGMSAKDRSAAAPVPEHFETLAVSPQYFRGVRF
jgi:hypothetical protein